MNAELNPAKAIFLEAVESHEPAQWPAFLDRACAGQPDLRQRVEVLLRAHREAGTAPQQTGPEGPAPCDAGGTVEHRGSVIGPYKLLQAVGEGGMGTVWMAEQTQPVQRKVALKITKAGTDSGQVLARFEAERQALALMDHPNIAKVLDGGATASGRPYFVMELVKGLPITRYCDEQRLTPRQRLELFVPVCQAIQHAHQKGIIHRDIKPSNVLVAPYDGRPVVKVIDFGVAKATGQRLTERTLFTEFGAVVGTLEYMSPEQAELNNQDIDTRSDIYSLGILLYELLTGTTPLTKQRLKQAAFTEVLRLIREEEPPKPSTRLSESKESLPSISAQRQTEPAKLAKLVRGDLDWIVMKALEKDRTRRYETANAFARDVQRYLADEPVEACPPSAGYRLRKFFRRNKRPILAASLVLLALVGGTVGTALGLIRAVQAESATRRTLIDVAAERDAKERARNEADANARRAEGEKTEANKARGLAEEERDRAKFEASRAADARHAIQMFLVQRAAEVGDVKEAERVLGEVDPPYRQTWEQRHLLHLCRRLALPLTGHTDRVEDVAFSPDGRRVVSVSYDRTVRVWDAATGRETLCLKGHSCGIINGVAFSPDGKRIASGGGTVGPDGEVIVWDAETGQRKLTIKVPEAGVRRLALSPDNQRLATACLDGAVRVWDAGTGGLKRAIVTTGFQTALCVAFSPDGKRLAACGMNSGVKVWDVESGEEKHSFPGEGNGFAGVAFSPDGSRLAGAARDFYVRVWDLATGQTKLTLAADIQTLSCVAFSPDGRLVAAGNWEGTARVWDAGTGRELYALNRHTAMIRAVAFSPDSRRLASASMDRTVLIWELGGVGPSLVLQRHKYPIHAVAFSPDGKWGASAGGARGVVRGTAGPAPPPTFGEVKVWDAETGQEKLSLKEQTQIIHGVVFSPDGRRLATAGGGGVPLSRGNTGQPGEVKVWDAETGQEKFALRGQDSPALCVAFSPDGRRLASGGADGTVRVWDAETGELKFSRKAFGSAVRSLAFRGDGRRLATAGGGDSVPLLRKGTGRPGEVKVWDVENGEEKLAFQGHTRQIASVAFSPDGRRLATGSPDGTVKVWDAETGEEKLTLKGHTAAVASVAFSPDGRRLASGGAEKSGKLGEVKLWDAATGQEKLALKGHAFAVSSLAFSADGRRVASAGEDRTVRVWDAPSEK